MKTNYKNFFILKKLTPMVNKFNSSLLLILLLCMLFSSSCKKRGCTEHKALNYCEKCKSEAGACEYMLTLTFYLDTNLAKKLDSLNIQEINLNVGYNDKSMQYITLLDKTISVTSLPQTIVDCENNPIKVKIKYKESEMPHKCSGSGILQPSSACFWINYSAGNQNVGVFCSGSLIVNLSTDGGCYHIPLLWGNCGDIYAN